MVSDMEAWQPMGDAASLKRHKRIRCATLTDKLDTASMECGLRDIFAQQPTPGRWKVAMSLPSSKKWWQAAAETGAKRIVLLQTTFHFSILLMSATPGCKQYMHLCSMHKGIPCRAAQLLQDKGFASVQPRGVPRQVREVCGYWA